MKAQRIQWAPVVEHAAVVVAGYATGVTLRQLFYRLVSDGTLPNTQSAYSRLSEHTARARREGTFPPLIDRGRTIHQAGGFTDAATARRWLAEQFRLERTEGQLFAVYLGVEKAGMVEQLASWFGDLGVPILALGGYSSQSYVDVVADDVARQMRPAVLLYAGDHDPSGEDIDRDFVARVAAARVSCAAAIREGGAIPGFDEVVRVALSWEQVVEYDLPPQPGKQADSRAAAFAERHGRLVQVELDALDPDVLRGLYADALAQRWDDDVYAAVLEREQTERDLLTG
jgi:hypothetical protein